MSSSEAVKRWRKNTKAKMIEAMGGSCQCCGYNTCNSALAFHHLNPLEKDIGFGDIRSNPISWSKIVEELRKCILVCHNCHSEIHSGVRKIPDTYSKFNEEFADWKKIEEYDKCPICKDKKPIRQKFCSHKCSQVNSRKIDWNSINLLDLLEKHSISDLEKILGVSNVAIYKRKNKILKHLDKQNEN